MSAHTHHHDGPEEHDLGLDHDLPQLLNRRRALGLMSGAGLAAALAACSGGTSTATTAPSASSTTGSGSTSAATVAGEVPEETAGPYPADGSNGVDVLGESGVVRSDIRSSFGGSTTTAQGVPMTMDLRVYDMNGSDVAPLAGAAVYVWHCDIDGRYSMYDQGIASENYLRGVQVSDADGRVRFTSIFPAAYSGRWPHVHFEVYASEADAVGGGGRLRTSQLALPQDACEAVYATSGYEQSVRNLAQTSLDSDMVFADGHSLQLATATGSPEDGYAVSLTIAV